MSVLGFDGGLEGPAALARRHQGFAQLKEEVKAFLQEEGHEVLDFGTDSEEVADYPDFCAAAARAVSRSCSE